MPHVQRSRTLTDPEMRLMIVAAMLVSIHAPASAAQPKPVECSVDSASFAPHAAAGVLRNCDVDKPARLRNPPAPSYRLPPDANCARATLEFVVDSSGRVDTTTALVIETDDRDFASAVIKTLARWQYDPAEHQGRRVRQLVRERRVVEGRQRGFTVTRGSAPTAAERARFVPCR